MLTAFLTRIAYSMRPTNASIAVLNKMRYTPLATDALCPMPYALCPMPARAPHVTEKGYRRSREYLLESEVEQLIAVAKANKNTFLATRKHLIILLSYRHGLRVSELTSLKWNQVDFTAARIHTAYSRFLKYSSSSL